MFFLFSHGKSQRLEFQEQNLSITGRTAGNPRPSGYGSLLTRVIRIDSLALQVFCDLNYGKGQKALNLFYKKREKS